MGLRVCDVLSSFTIRDLLFFFYFDVLFEADLNSKPAQLKARMEKIITFDNNDGNIYRRLDDILNEVMPKIKEYHQVGWTAPLADWMPKVTSKFSCSFSAILFSHLFIYLSTPQSSAHLMVFSSVR